MNLSTLRRKVEFGDAVLFTYIIPLALQCFWVLESRTAAFVLASLASALVWLLHISTKPAPQERTPREFWIIVAIPLFIVFLIRAPLPDLAFDVLNHRLIQAERSLRGPQLLPNDFFPTIFPFNPLPDMLTGIFRHALGYRLGTIINFLAVVWAATVVEKLLRSFIRSSKFRCVAVLLIMCTEHALFQINSYMVDALALPLLLEGLRATLEFSKSTSKTHDLLFIALMLGAATAYKLTNAAMVAPILVILTYQVVRTSLTRKALRTTGLAAVLFFMPMLPHALYIFRETGNPVFPLYNNLIRSPLWPKMTPYDGRWGPRTLGETLYWPFTTLWQQSRLSELGVYSGRLTLALAAALVCLLLRRIDKQIRLIAVVVVLASLLWSATSGYVRYALFVELIGGVLLIYLTHYLMEFMSMRARWLRVMVAAFPLVLLSTQSVAALNFVGKTEWSKRPTLFDDRNVFRKEARWIWRDRNLMDFQPSQNRAAFEQVDAWIVSSVKSNGVEVLLRPNVPMLAVNNLEYFDMPESRRRFARALESLRGKRVYSLCLTEELASARTFLQRKHLDVLDTKTLLVPFFSTRTQFSMALIEIGLPAKRETPRRPADAPLTIITEATSPLDDDAFVAAVDAPGVPSVLKPGQVADIQVRVRNGSEFAWPAKGRSDFTYLITVSNGWLDANGSLVDNTDGKNVLPHDLWPGEEAVVPLKITAPPAAGDYILEIDLVQEGITWFKDRGSQPFRTRIKVQ